MSRRALLSAAVVGAAGTTAATATAGAVIVRHSVAAMDVEPIEFRGERQAGIVTAAQDRLHFASFDVITRSKSELARMLQQWTVAAERMTRGEETFAGGAVGLNDYLPPTDTGEALGLAAASLTLTIGFGPSLFGPDASDPFRDDRFGLAHRRPAALAPLEAFGKDQLDPARSGGDICVQACADDPQVAVHAIRNLARMGFGVVSVRWSQLGFGRTSSTSISQHTPRNMFGFKDGTANLKAEDTALLDRWVWVDRSDNTPATQWMTGGSYLVARRIRMHIERWDRTSLFEQEAVIGRTKGDGAPLGQTGEFDAPNFQLSDGTAPVIPRTAHVRLAHADNLGGVKLLRRGYNFTDGSDGFGHLDAGLFFIAFCRDPHRQFVPMQQALAERDGLNEYITHVGSALFGCPPGVGAGQWWGQTLFDN
ncbi:deferrochelatase/peroxidase EfeB [Gordonia sp. TBRC 11910]|uniref:Deferrochelatase n=1 Tax=Gordonia asplenii TaxID=2725283 RepID=A0A848L7U7_9ACTN|nr:deferrochelatase/peroxidase EfeB [Gordonia asplenii]